MNKIESDKILFKNIFLASVVYLNKLSQNYYTLRPQ